MAGYQKSGDCRKRAWRRSWKFEMPGISEPNCLVSFLKRRTRQLEKDDLVQVKSPLLLGW